MLMSFLTQVRKRTLRMLSETLSPASTRPTPLELPWLQVGWIWALGLSLCLQFRTGLSNMAVADPP